MKPLATTIESLELHFDAARWRLEKDIQMYRRIPGWVEPDGPITPETMKDSNGRFILLDALVAIAHAKAALGIKD